MKKIIKILVLVFIACLTIQTITAQNLEWAINIGGESIASGRAIAVDNSGNVYTVGAFTGIGDFNQGTGIEELSSINGSNDVFVQKTDASGNFLWAKSFGGPSSDIVVSVALDNSGNIYTTGYFIGTSDFEPGNGTTELSSIGGRDIFVQKMDASGNFIWAKSFGGTMDDEPKTIRVGNSGNIYLTGFFRGTVDFDPGTGIENITSSGGKDVFVQKMDASGNFIWVKTFGGASTEDPNGLTLDASENIYTTGRFSGVIDFNPGTETENLTANFVDIFVQKLSSSGDFIWARNFGGINSNEFDYSRSISIDALGNVYTSGLFEGTADFDPGTGTTELTSEGEYDAFVQKMDASGNFIWVKTYGGIGADTALSTSIDPSGNIYTLGSFEETIDIDPGTGTENLTVTSGSTDIFVQKLNASGEFVWAYALGSSAYEYAIEITTDNSNNIYTTGYFAGTMDFDPGPGTTNLSVEVGTTDAFLQKINGNTLGLSELQKNIGITAFPNPNNGSFKISNNKILDDVTIIVTDIHGKIVFKQNYSSLSEATINIKGSSGVYLLTLKTPKEVETIRLIKN